MVKSPNRAASCSRYNEPRVHPSILSLETPKAEDIARAIWQRQRDALGPGAIAYNAEWRDQSIPSRFWDEFLLDAYAVLSLLYRSTSFMRIPDVILQNLGVSADCLFTRHPLWPHPALMGLGPI